MVVHQRRQLWLNRRAVLIQEDSWKQAQGSPQPQPAKARTMQLPALSDRNSKTWLIKAWTREIPTKMQKMRKTYTSQKSTSMWHWIHLKTCISTAQWSKCPSSLDRLVSRWRPLAWSWTTQVTTCCTSYTRYWAGASSFPATESSPSSWCRMGIL